MAAGRRRDAASGMRSHFSLGLTSQVVELTILRASNTNKQPPAATGEVGRGGLCHHSPSTILRGSSHFALAYWTFVSRMNTPNGPQPPIASREKATKTLRASFARYQAELLGLLFYLVGNPEDAHDAFRETFNRCWRRRQSMPGDERLRSWTFQIALSVGREKRSVAWRRRHRELPEEEELVQPDDASASDQPQRGRQVAVLRRALLQLRSEEQEVFLLYQNGRMSYEEVAEVIKVPLATVKMRMRLALGKLREALDHGA